MRLMPNSHKNMEADKALFLQKQIKENSEDLQKEFLDMEAWEEQMKKKDIEIRHLKNNEPLPAVRSKIKKKSIPTPEVSKDEKPKKTKRTKTLDYEAWNKFDADAACKEIDNNSNLLKEKKEKIYELPSEEELEKDHTKAITFKNEGNALVKKQEYAKAVGKYSDAIKVFPHDATFYANRALCQLKINNLYSAEADCTTAIQLDKFYVKAYHRRATARIELKRFKDAEKDIEIVLKLDPSNSEAKSMLANVKKKIDNSSKPLIISGEKNNEKCSIEKAIGEKLLGKKLPNAMDDISAKQDEQNRNESTKIKQSHENTSNDEKIIKTEIIKQNNDSMEKTENQLDKNLKIGENNQTFDIKEDPELPSWLPKLKTGISIIQPLTKNPRLNQKLKRIIVNEIPPNESIFKDIEEVSKEKTSQTVKQLNDISKINDIRELKNKTNRAECCSTNNIEVIKSLPPPPNSSVNFMTNWRKNISPNFRRKYLKQIAPKDLPNIFKESMESNIFSEILSILNTEFISNNDKVYDLLSYFGKVKRFRALILFMTQKDKEALRNLFEYCKTNESKTDDDINYLHSIYEM